MNDTQSKLLQEITEYAKTARTVEDLMRHIADELHEKMARFNWVGFYVLDPTDPNYLIVGPFAGSKRSHPSRQGAVRRRGRHRQNGRRR